MKWLEKKKANNNKALSNRNTFTETFDRVQDEMNRMLDSFFSDSKGSLASTSFHPCCDVEENEKNILIKAELPGMEEKDLNITVKDDLLTIKGEKKEENEEKSKTSHIRESSYGYFERSFRLPSNVDLDKVNARFKKGVLRLEIPKDPAKAPKAIEVKAE